jgi:hypothetical protein
MSSNQTLIDIAKEALQSESSKITLPSWVFNNSKEPIHSEAIMVQLTTEEKDWKPGIQIIVQVSFVPLLVFERFLHVILTPSDPKVFWIDDKGSKSFAEDPQKWIRKAEATIKHHENGLVVVTSKYKVESFIHMGLIPVLIDSTTTIDFIPKE